MSNNDYKLYSFNDLPNGLELVFRNKKESRSLTFIPMNEDFAIRFKRKNAIVDWSMVDYIAYKEVNNASDDSGIFIVRLKGKSNIFGEEELQLGLIGKENWSAIYSSYSNKLSLKVL